MIDSSAKNGQIMTEQLRILNKKKKTRTKILTSWLLVCLSVFYFLYGELETLVFLLYLGKIAVNPRRIALLLERLHDYYWCG